VEYTRDWDKRQKYLLQKVPTSLRPWMEQYTARLIRERYSWNTLKQYSAAFCRWLHHLPTGIVPDQVGADTINQYLNGIAVSNVSYQEINRHISALKFYYERILNLDLEIMGIRRPRRPKSLPKVMSIGEVSKLLAGTSNIKHLSMLYLAYGSGLRSGEILDLKIHDLHLENKQIWVRKGKGNKDRVVVLSQTSIDLLLQYLSEVKPNYWLFEGQTKGKPYSPKSLSMVFKRALEKAGLTQNYTLHSLRHSFATHLYDQGVDILKIQRQLGHADLKTTLIYTHLSNQASSQIISPLDRLKIPQKGHKKG
jgi:site-specific recombinase XerD